MIPAKSFLKIKYFLKSGDAVAEVLDFVTVIGILILSFSVIGLAGYPILKIAQDTRYTENTRQSFVVMAESINKVALGQTPSRNLELKMYGGSLSVAGSSTINITATRFNATSIPPKNEEISIVPTRQMRSIENTIGDNVVAYEGTGVWVRYPTGTVLNAYKPLITNRSDVLVIPVVSITGDAAASGSGMSELTVCQQKVPSDQGGCGMPSIDHWSNVSNITVTITGNYTTGWQDYFTKIMKWSYTTGGTYTARLNTTTNLDVYILNAQIYTEIE